MLNKTHISGGVSFAASTYQIIKNTNLTNIDIPFYNNNMNFELGIITCLLFAIIGSIIPDIDKNNSWIAQSCPIKFYKVLKHRGFTHSFLLIFILFVISFYFNQIELFYFNIGILSHRIFDEIYNKLRKFKNYNNIELTFFYLNWIISIALIILSFIK